MDGIAVPDIYLGKLIRYHNDCDRKNLTQLDEESRTQPAGTLRPGGQKSPGSGIGEGELAARLRLAVLRLSRQSASSSSAA